jgi:hypothetical protein
VIAQRSTLDAIALRFPESRTIIQTIDRTEQRATGGRGRIRTFVARKERQIYSLLVLATHPPVPRKQMDANCLSPKTFSGKSSHLKTYAKAKTQKGLVSKDTSPFIFPARICSASLPYQFLVELAEGIEPPTL